MKKLLLLLALLTCIGTLSACNKKLADDDSSTVGPGTKDDSAIEGWTLVWNDEFDYEGPPSPAKWSYDVGGSGWGNNEKQYYTQNRAENARVAEGVLTIEARKELFQKMNYTSARLLSKGEGHWLYGRVEVRAKLPAGRGTWPAIWMLPSDWVYGGWPNSGEIDIMEHVGYDPAVIHGSTHSLKYYFKIGTQKTGTVKIPTAMSAFHTYAIEWYADRIDFYVDDLKYFTSLNDGTGWEAWPFDKRFHLILNIAIGGDWGGAQGIDDAMFNHPVEMVVDYVRVYTKNK